MARCVSPWGEGDGVGYGVGNEIGAGEERGREDHCGGSGGALKIAIRLGSVLTHRSVTRLSRLSPPGG